MRLLIAGLLLICSLVPKSTIAQTAAEVRKQLPATVGLIVHVGTTDGKLEAELAKSGRLLVHGITLDDDAVAVARKTIRAAGAYGIATVQKVTDLKRLPYANNLVNLLVADLDVQTELREEEVLRVLVPGSGRGYLRRGGKWTTIDKPSDPKTDDWRHQHGNPQNNPVSSDKTIRPTNTVRWLDGFGRFDQTMGGRGGIPVAGEGMLIHEDVFGRNLDESLQKYNRLYARDAFNGLVQWANIVGGARLSLVVTDKLVLSAYPPPGKEGQLFVYDLKSGELLRELNVKVNDRGISTTVQPMYVDGVAYVIIGEQLIAWEPETGKTRWTYQTTNAESLFSPSITPDGTRIVVAEQAKRRTGLNARWPWVRLAAVTCLDTKTGKPRWRNTELEGLYTAHMPVTNDYVLWYATWGIGSHYEQTSREERANLPRDFGVLDAKTGKIIWQKGLESDEGALAKSWVQVGLIHGDEAMLCESKRYLGYDLATGKLTRNVEIPVVNQRCVRTRALPDYILTGFGIFYDLKSGEFTDQNISRSACAVGALPAYGMLFEQPSGCGCFAQIRNTAGFTYEEPLPALPATARLEKGPRVAERGGKVSQLPEAATINVAKKNEEPRLLRLTVITDQPLRDSWRNNEVLPFPETDPVQHGDLKLVAVVHEHRLEARRGDDIVWAFTADARISGQPIVHDGRIYFGAHDGWVYCLDAGKGDMLWRSLVAPAHRRIVAFGQLESSWPIRGVVEYKGAICASAGRHPELDGGIYLAGLDPTTGTPRWQGQLHFDSASLWLDADMRNEHKHLNWITNDRLVVNDGQLFLKGLDWVHGGGNYKDSRMEPYPIDPANPPQ